MGPNSGSLWQAWISSSGKGAVTCCGTTKKILLFDNESKLYTIGLHMRDTHFYQVMTNKTLARSAINKKEMITDTVKHCMKLQLLRLYVFCALCSVLPEWSLSRSKSSLSFPHLPTQRERLKTKLSADNSFAWKRWKELPVSIFVFIFCFLVIGLHSFLSLSKSRRFL